VVAHIEEHEAGRLRSHVARTLRLRYTPQLRFYVDDSLDRAQRIHDLIDRVKPADDADGEDND
jgi:ribosome-binding factor A